MILIVEDDKSVREFVTRALREDGHSVTTVDNGAQALELLESENVDLLLSDIRMPEMDGICLARKVSQERPGLPIVLMTGFAAEEERAVDLSAVIHDVITKPFTLRQIRETTAAALKGA